jgi:short-subunit dehydrogenase
MYFLSYTGIKKEKSNRTMNLKKKYGNTAMIAGASEGIGGAFAAFLAKEGFDLVLIARRQQPLELLAESLRIENNIKVTCMTCDLSDDDAIQQIQEKLKGMEINLLVYNAVQSYIGPFIRNSHENHLQMARLNMITPLSMIHQFGEKMLAKGQGAIVLMTSLAGFQGSGYLSMYAATKAFNHILGESLWFEWKKSGVDIIACCAGATSTPNFRNTNPEKNSFFAPRILLPAEIPVECFRKLGRQPSCITGRGNRVASFIMQKILPRKAAINIMGETTRKMYRL